MPRALSLPSNQNRETCSDHTELMPQCTHLLLAALFSFASRLWHGGDECAAILFCLGCPFSTPHCCNTPFPHAKRENASIGVSHADVASSESSLCASVALMSVLGLVMLEISGPIRGRAKMCTSRWVRVKPRRCKTGYFFVYIRCRKNGWKVRGEKRSGLIKIPTSGGQIFVQILKARVQLLK